jgi:hypothetical protein
MENYKSTYLERQKTYGSDKLCWEEEEEAEEVEAEEAEAEENIRLKQYVSLHSKGRHNDTFSIPAVLILSPQPNLVYLVWQLIKKPEVDPHHNC